MRTLLCLVAIVATQAHAANQPLKISPDEAYNHRTKNVTVCGTVRDANLSYVGGRIYFIAKNDARVWAVGAPLAQLAPKMGTLRGAEVCARGRVYSNLEGVGIDVDDQPDSVALIAERDITVALPPPLPPWNQATPGTKVAKSPKVSGPSNADAWAPVIVQLGELLGTALAGGPVGSYTPPATYAPSHGYNSRTTSISDVSRGGEVITMMDGSVWEVHDMDRIHSSLWLTGRVTIVKGQGVDEYVLVRDNSSKSVRARRVR